MVRVVVTPELFWSQYNRKQGILTDEQQDAFDRWWTGTGLAGERVYRLEIDVEHRTATVFAYALNEQGKPYRDPNDWGQVAKRDPYTIWLRELPPVALWERD